MQPMRIRIYERTWKRLNQWFMGLLDFLNKAKDSAMAAKDKAVQYVKDNVQIREEVSEETKAWKTFDPKMLKAILDDKPDRAAEIYVQKTGATIERAEVVVKNITGVVKKEYPAILRAQAREADIQSIKKVWPFGSKPFNVFGFPTGNNEKKSIAVLTGQLKAKGRNKYTLSINVLYGKPVEVNVVFKNDHLYYEDVEMDDLELHTDDYVFLFNPKDERYKMMVSMVESISRLKTLRLYEKVNMEKFRNKQMDKEALLKTITTFKIKNNNISILKSNIADDFCTLFIANAILEKMGDMLPFKYSTFKYVESYGVEYAISDVHFEVQWEQFCQNVDVNGKILCRNSWNSDIYGEAGLVIYSGLTKLIEKASLPLKLIAVTLYDHKITYEYKVVDSFFDYYFEMPDERTWLERVTNSNADALNVLAQADRQMQEVSKQMIQILVKKPKFILEIDAEKNVSFTNMISPYGGFFDDIEFNSPAEKEKITFETFANFIHSSELKDFRCHQEPQEPEAEMKDEEKDEPKKEKSRVKSDQKETHKSTADKPIVELYSTVTIRDCQNDEVRVLKIVPDAEYDKLCNEGKDRGFIPENVFITQSILGKSKGDFVTNVDDLGIKFEYEILFVKQSSK